MEKEFSKSHSVTSLSGENEPGKNNSSSYASSNAPQISLPKGGGAIRSIDEKFSVNASNGTSGFSISLPFSASRNSFAPSMSLSYNSGSGNSIFGLGWIADAPSIARKTQNRLPKYNDSIDSDIFMISGAEDLVPAYKKDDSGNWIKDSSTSNGATITRYHPRIDAGFSRIEKITEANGNVYWKTITGNNEVSIFGKSKSAQISDPSNPSNIFRWLFEFSYDDKGNCFQYAYKQEDRVNVPTEINEKNRINNNSSTSNVYLKRIKYCNKTHLNRNIVDLSNWDFFLNNIEYLLELVFDYGEHDQNDPQPKDDKGWLCRADAFSDYRAGFEIRTYRLCRRILMFHSFSELGTTPCLVKSLDINYTEGPVITFLHSFIQKGYIRMTDGTYSQKSFPAIEFSYEQLAWNTAVQSLPDLSNTPVGIEDKEYQWVDLYKEGISGIITEQSGAWHYKSNAGNGNFDGVQVISGKPNIGCICAATTYFSDIEAKGQQFLISPELKGYFELSDDNKWLPFKNLSESLNIDMHDPNLKMLDLTGDGTADILISEESVFRWYPSKGKDGYGNYKTVSKVLNEEQGPNIVFADSKESIVLADMSGDGLVDIVRIRSSEVCYWPNLGHGRFGAKVTMCNPPVFDNDNDFNPHYIKLADIDGSGATDIIYLGHNSFKIYFNQCGNSWSDVNIVHGVNPLPFPKIDIQSNISIVDLLGNGTACIVWSSPLPKYANGLQMQYIDLQGGKKPHIMTSYRNNMGKEVQVSYLPSTYYYLQDKKAGTPWVTKLPFPVQCVSEVVILNHVSKTRFTNQYTYHHGYYDHAEKEFRGFGRVDQTDTEDFDLYKQNSAGGLIQLVDEGFHQPPLLTKTWFHTGAFLDNEKLLVQFAHEYYNNNIVPEKELLDPPLPNNLTADEWREAARACKGLPLRVETYSLDGSAEEQYPYTTSRHSCIVQLIQPRANNPYAAFMVQASETLMYNYERNPADPRVSHNMVIEIDAFGNVLKTALINYGRKSTDPALTNSEQAIQAKTHVIFTINYVTNNIDTDSDYRLPGGYESLTYEITGVTPATGDYFSATEMSGAFETAALIGYEVPPTNGLLQKRVIEQGRTLFYKDDLSGPLEPGTIASVGLTYQAYKLSLTPGLRDSIYGNKADDSLLIAEGKYAHFNDGNYWIASGIQTHDATNFYQVVTVTDAFGLSAQIQYDNNYHYFIQQVTDAINNTTSIAGFNYRTLLPYLVKDINDNLSGVRNDELGMVISAFAMGKQGENKGDFMDPASIEASANDFPGSVLVCHFDSYSTSGKPNFIKTTVYETDYFTRLQTGIAVSSQITYAYSDGGGAVLMQKKQVSPGIALQENEDGTVVEVDTTPNLRWVGNGRTILNNKGNPVKQYEPYFSTTFEFEDSKLLVERGATSITTYDAGGRQIRVDMPDGTFTKMKFDAWSQQTFDQNDTVLESQWYKDRITVPVTGISTPEQVDAANKASAHANTPTVSYLDSLGKIFLAIADNAAAGKYKTLIETDIEGNLRSSTDARGNIIVQYKYDMLGAELYKNINDGGERWVVNDVMGKPIRNYDSRNHIIRNEYDFLHRPVKMFIQTDAETEINTSKIIYGESLMDGKQRNLRGKTYKSYETIGVVTNEMFDFKGNLLSTATQLLKTYKSDADWSVLSDADLEADNFQLTGTFDAMNRPVQVQTPDGSIMRPVYDETGILNQVYIRVKGAAETLFVKDIQYDAKGQRQHIVYGNNTAISYKYDPNTFRLVQLLTTGKNGTDVLQNVTYIYDAVGNITTAQDDARQTLFYNNAVVSPTATYTYDAIYQLITATGREHIGQNQPPSAHDEFRINLPSPGDGSAMRNYTQNYQYDTVGNILQMIHAAGVGSWTRQYNYEASNNRLSSTKVNDTTENYAYDPHGNIQSLLNLTSLTWNFKNQLQQVDLGGGGTAYYVYNNGGKRVRKVIERQGGVKEERIYLGNFELYRKTDSSNTVLEATETLHAMDDTHRIAMVETKTIKNGATSSEQLIRYQYSNHLGSSTLELDDNGVIISYEEYHPFGTTSYQAVNAIIQTAYKRYRYTGMERDDETGLEYHGARYYLPWLGRWLSVDPAAGKKGGRNFYAYTSNNPIVYTDPNGMDRVLATSHAVVATPTGSLTLLGERRDKAILNTGLEPMEIAEMEHFELVFGAIGHNSPLSSGVMMQSALEGEEGITAIHMYLRGVDDVLAFTHTSDEVRTLIASIQAQTHKVDVYFAHATGGDVSIFRAGSQVNTGAPLPKLLEPHLTFDGSIPYGSGWHPHEGFSNVLPRVIDEQDEINTAKIVFKTPASPNGAASEAASSGASSTVSTATNTSSKAAIVAEEAAGASRFVTIGSKVIKYGAKGVVIAGRVATVAIITYYAVKHGYIAITEIIDGHGDKAFLEALYFAEDVLPVPSGRPTKITFPDLGPNQTWAKSDQGLFGRKSGCTVCHTSVQVDNWSKTTVQGKMSVMLNGPAVDTNGMANDWAVRAMNGN